MTLSQAGESRLNGYLFVLGRALSAFLPGETVRDALREIESHIRERVAASPSGGDERAALERILAELGPPLRVAQAYAAERTLDEAVATGRLVPVIRAVWHLAVSTVAGFFAGIGLLVGYFVGAASLVVAALKPIFPANVGIWANSSGIPVNFGAQFPAPADLHLVGGYWVILLGVVCGACTLVFTHRCARALLGWFQRRRRTPAFA